MASAAKPAAEEAMPVTHREIQRAFNTCKGSDFCHTANYIQYGRHPLEGLRFCGFTIQKEFIRGNIGVKSYRGDSFQAAQVHGNGPIGRHIERVIQVTPVLYECNIGMCNRCGR